MISYAAVLGNALPTRVPRVLPAWPGWFPVLAFVGSGIYFREQLPGWVVMVVIFFGLYAGFKWQVLWNAIRHGSRPSVTRAAAYLFLSAGVDARAFLEPAEVPARPAIREWIIALVKMFSGFVLTFVLARRVYAKNAWLSAWVGMIGCVLMGHFGSFHLLALAWRRAGVNAQLVMRAPFRAVSLSDLWGNRWNLPFRDIMHSLALRPLAPHLGTTTGMLGVFLVSGLLHELVISVPARGGYGLPTLYFLLQGAGVTLERSPLGRQMGLRRGWRGWAFAFLFAAVPAVILFHKPFLENVGAPLLHAIRALP